jgi:hypothetical protein
MINRQTFGTSMGNTLTPFLTNIFNLTVKAEDLPESMNLIRRRYILRCEEEHNRPDARDNEPTSQYDQIHT